MTHDPLCPFRPAQTGVCDRPIASNISCAVLHISQPEVPCQCELIAEVRVATLRDAVSALREANLFSRDYLLAVDAIKGLGGER